MSSPAGAFILICPTCGKKYQGDPSRPAARFQCPVDKAELQREAAAAPDAAARATQQLSADEIQQMLKQHGAGTQRETQQLSADEIQQMMKQHGAGTQRETQQLSADEIQQMLASHASAAGEDEEATRVLQPEEKTVVANDEQKTRMIPQQGEAESAPVTVSSTVTEERRSVLSMLDHGTSAAAAMAKEKYEVVGKLGQGGVGEVLKVRDRDLKREVAMKMLIAREGGVSEDALVRFIEEAQATGQLEHPNIVPVHDLGVDGKGRVYFTLKYVQGASLKKVIKGRNDDAELDDNSGRYRERFSPLRMVEILISMCQALAYAHSKGIIHRDLKPDNVMLGKYGEVLVMDWGLAKVLGKAKRADASDTVRITTSRGDDQTQSTIEGSIAGTPAYMSPEQAAGRISELDQRTDIYALGAILYEMLTGEPPYRGAGALAVVRQVVDGPPPALKAQKGAFGFDPIPRELRAICEKAMARRPEERYATASLLRDDLQAYLEQEPVSAAPDSALQRAMKWVRRNQRQVKTSSISAGLALLLIVGSYYGYRIFTVNKLVNDGSEKLSAARKSYSEATSKPMHDTDHDAYAHQAWVGIHGEKVRAFRLGVNSAIEPLRRVVDIDPQNKRARLLLSESYMELWRRAVEEENTELARSLRGDIERYAPQPSPFAEELNGFGKLAITASPANAQVYLFSFEMLRAKDASGAELPARLVPVPFDLAKLQTDKAFLEAERKRIEQGSELPAEKHSVYNLEPTQASLIGRGAANFEKLPPGSYMLLLRAEGHSETRLPFRMARRGEVKRTVVMPANEQMPAGFFYMAGGEVTVGGTTAGAPAPHVKSVPPSLIYHDEISVAEYAAFLKDLVKRGKAAEARQRLPKDFGKNLATLNAAGELVPADGSDPIAFGKSPVRGVSFNDANGYIAWRSGVDGYAYRLPKDWEWEAACRGADARTYSWGNQPGKGLAVVTQGYGDTGANMSWKWEDYKDESPWGIHNLAGGVAEWTASQFDPKAKPSDPVFGQLAIRGNAWALPPTGLECAFRTSGQPDYFHPTIGFRMALDFPPQRVGEAKDVPAIVHEH